VPNLDDERLEIYLKKFRPLAPAPLPLDAPSEAPEKSPRRAVIAVWALGAAAAVILALVMLRGAVNRVPQSNAKTNVSRSAPERIAQPLTLGAANRLLLGSPSFAAALRSLESESDSSAIPKGKESALAVLSQENLKP
jgi:ferric-dicitrate binding protein FerR (iron transport regulator)